MSCAGGLADVQNAQCRIGNHLSEDTPGPAGDRSLNRFLIQTGNKVCVNAQPFQVIEQSDRPAVQTAGCDDLIPRDQKTQQGV